MLLCAFCAEDEQSRGAFGRLRAEHPQGVLAPEGPGSFLGSQHDYLITCGALA